MCTKIMQIWIVHWASTGACIWHPHSPHLNLSHPSEWLNAFTAVTSCVIRGIVLCAVVYSRLAAGCTAVVALKHGDEFYVANAGTSECNVWCVIDRDPMCCDDYTCNIVYERWGSLCVSTWQSDCLFDYLTIRLIFLLYVCDRWLSCSVMPRKWRGVSSIIWPQARWRKHFSPLSLTMINSACAIWLYFIFSLTNSLIYPATI